MYTTLANKAWIARVQIACNVVTAGFLFLGDTLAQPILIGVAVIALGASIAIYIHCSKAKLLAWSVASATSASFAALPHLKGSLLAISIIIVVAYILWNSWIAAKTLKNKG